MTKDKDIKTVVPALRFPEFRDAEGWKEKPLIKVAHVIAGQSPEGSSYNENGVGMPFYQGKTDFGEIFLNSPTKWTTQTTKTANEGDILMSVRAPVGTLNISTNEICIGRGLAAIQPYQNKWFLYYFLNSIQNSIIGNGGSVFDSINKDQIEKIEILIPENPKEQETIANCLGSLDDLINAVADKIEALKEHKKGLMQHLFPADGKTTPTLRFPEFQNAGDWIETTLGEEVYYENGKAHENDIDEAGQYIVVNSKFISTDGEVIKYTDSPSCLADKGDILMVLSDVPNGRAIAKCLIVDSNNKYTVNQRICKLKPKKVVGLLLYYIINRNPFLLAFDDGIKQTNLKKDDVLNCPFRVPKDPKEQQRIADCLLAVDELTSAEADKLNQLKAHKKGLMQQLFPTINK